MSVTNTPPEGSADLRVADVAKAKGHTEIVIAAVIIGAALRWSAGLWMPTDEERAARLLREAAYAAQAVAMTKYYEKRTAEMDTEAE